MLFTCYHVRHRCKDRLFCFCFYGVFRSWSCTLRSWSGLFCEESKRNVRKKDVEGKEVRKMDSLYGVKKRKVRNEEGKIDEE